MSSIRVALRIRPEVEDASDERSEGTRGNCLGVNDKTVSIRRHKRDGSSEISHQYTFDNVFDEDATQDEVFSNVKDLVDDGLKGFNVTVFAFGMTGSGKTHTISGFESWLLGWTRASNTGSPCVEAINDASHAGQ